MDALVSTPALRTALVGVPNCGKTALFNRLTGSRQKVANYPGVTVEKREGERAARDGRTLRVLDLPGHRTLLVADPGLIRAFACVDCCSYHRRHSVRETPAGAAGSV